MEDVIKFLEINGFQLDSDGFYDNKKCQVVLQPFGYSVIDNEGEFFLYSHEIYGLIGYLTYQGYMEKNYKQP